MINRTAIIQWNKVVPWNDNAQVEQIPEHCRPALINDGTLPAR